MDMIELMMHLALLVFAPAFLESLERFLGFGVEDPSIGQVPLKRHANLQFKGSGFRV